MGYLYSGMSEKPKNPFWCSCGKKNTSKRHPKKTAHNKFVDLQKIKPTSTANRKEGPGHWDVFSWHKPTTDQGGQNEIDSLQVPFINSNLDPSTQFFGGPFVDLPNNIITFSKPRCMAWIGMRSEIPGNCFETSPVHGSFGSKNQCRLQGTTRRKGTKCNHVICGMPDFFGILIRITIKGLPSWKVPILILTKLALSCSLKDCISHFKH